MDATATEKMAHTAHRDALAALFRANVGETIDAHNCRMLVGENYMQRISECRRQLQMNIECVPQYAVMAGRRKRITGAYRFRPDALGRDAEDFTDAKEQDLFTELSGWQR